MIGYFIWCWNDEEWLEECLSTFRATTDIDYLLGILNASTDNSANILMKYCDEVKEYRTPVSIVDCVNCGYASAKMEGCDYTGWIHPDMRFHQEGWVEILQRTLEHYPSIGRISPCNISTPRREPGIYQGAEAGNLMHKDVVQKVGEWDRGYIGCGGYEDWDLQRRLIEMNLGSYFTTAAEVWHQHNGTREKIDHGMRYQQFLNNQSLYHNKWRTYDNAMVPEGWQDLPVVR